MVDTKNFAQQRLSESNMTVQELLELVEEIVAERLSIEKPMSRKAIAEWWQDVRDNLIVLPPGAKSPTEILREERDQWYKP